MTDSFALRPATVEDIPHLLHHRRAMYDDMGHKDRAAMDKMAAASEEYFRKAVPSGRYRGWLALSADGSVIGGAGIVLSDWPGGPAEFKPQRAMILNVYVEPEFRRRGIARKLMETVIDWCRQQGFAHVGLHASDKGRSLYEAMGFKQTNEMRLSLT
jgi:GNAT superfamily N-acetyltransferase